MANYDAITGFDEFTLNTLSQQLYTALYPRLFNGMVVAGEQFVYAIHYDITAAPQFVLQPSQLALDYLNNQLTAMEMSSGDREMFRRSIASDIVTFDLVLPRVTIGAEFRKGGHVSRFAAAITAGCKADFAGSGMLFLTILATSISIDGEPELSALANTILMPRIQMKLNDLFEQGIRFPRLRFSDAPLAAPAVRLHGRSLIGCAALADNGPTIPPAEAFWPAQKTIVMLDDDVADTVAADMLKSLRQSGSSGFAIPVWPVPRIDLKVEAWYDVGLRNPRFDIGTGNTTSATVEAYGSGHVTVQLGDLPAIHLGLGIAAEPNMEVSLAVAAGVVTATFVWVNDGRVDISLEGAPDFLSRYVSDIVSGLTTPITQSMGLMLSGLTIPIYTLPATAFDVADLHLEVDLFNVEIDTLLAPDGRVLATVTGDVLVRKGAAEPTAIPATPAYAGIG